MGKISTVFVFSALPTTNEQLSLLPNKPLIILQIPATCKVHSKAVTNSPGVSEIITIVIYNPPSPCLLIKYACTLTFRLSIYMTLSGCEHSDGRENLCVCFTFVLLASSIY